MSSIDRYLPYINNAIAQRGQARANQFRQGGADISQLLQALSQIAQANQQNQQGQDLFRGAVGNSTTPAYNVNTDLLGKPMQQQTLGGSSNYIDQTGMRELIASGNPVAQKMFGNFLTAEEAQRPRYEQFDTTKDRTDVNMLSPTAGKTIVGVPKPEATKMSTGFADFLNANKSKYENVPDGLSQAYSDYQAQGMEQFKEKEKTKAGLRAQKDGKKIGEYASDDGYKTILWKNPDNTIIEIKSRDKMIEKPESPTLQKQDAQLSSLLELANRVEGSAKPEYLGGFVSGLSGKGMGGVTGGIREATGFIEDDEVQFRSDVSSISDQLLRARSGAQINEAEYQRLLKEVPTVDLPKNVFDARMKAFKKRVQDVIDAKKSGGGKQKSTSKTIKVGGATITVED